MVTPQELELLSLRALVAFATRCAMRVRPLYRLPEHVVIAGDPAGAVDRAIRVAAACAAGTVDPGATDTDAVNAAQHAAAVAGATFTVGDGNAARTAANVARAASWAAACGTEATKAWTTGEIASKIGALRAAVNAASAARAAAGDTPPREGAFDHAATDDYEKLLELGGADNPVGHGDPIDPSESGPLGPLWPDGEPAWLRPDQATISEAVINGPLPPIVPPLTLYFDTSEFSDEEIASILHGLSDLYRDLGGDALVIDRMELLDPALALSPEEV